MRPHGQLPDRSPARTARRLAGQHPRPPRGHLRRAGTRRLLRGHRGGAHRSAAHGDRTDGHGPLHLPRGRRVRHGHHRRRNRRHADRAGGRGRHGSLELRGIRRRRQLLRHPHPLQDLLRGRVRRSGRRDGHLEGRHAHAGRPFRRGQHVGRLLHLRPRQEPQRPVPDRRLVRLGGERPREPPGRERHVGLRRRAERRRSGLEPLPGADRSRRLEPRPHRAVLHAPLPGADPPEPVQRRERRVHGCGFPRPQDPLAAVHLLQQLGHLPHADPAAGDAHARRGVGRRAVAPRLRRTVGRRIPPLGAGQHRDRRHAGRPHADPHRQRLGLRRAGLRPLSPLPDHARERRGSRRHVAGRGGAPGPQAVPRKGVLERLRTARIHLRGLRHRPVRAARRRRRVRLVALFRLRPLVAQPLQPRDRMVAVAQRRRLLEIARRGLARIDLQELLLDGSLRPGRSDRDDRRQGRGRKAPRRVLRAPRRRLRRRMVRLGQRAELPHSVDLQLGGPSGQDREGHQPHAQRAVFERDRRSSGQRRPGDDGRMVRLRLLGPLPDDPRRGRLHAQHADLRAGDDAPQARRPHDHGRLGDEDLHHGAEGERPRARPCMDRLEGAFQRCDARVHDVGETRRTLGAERASPLLRIPTKPEKRKRI